MVIFETEKQRV